MQKLAFSKEPLLTQFARGVCRELYFELFEAAHFKRNREQHIHEYARFTMLEWCPNLSLKHGREVLKTRLPNGDKAYNITHDDIIRYARKNYDALVTDIKTSETQHLQWN